MNFPSVCPHCGHELAPRALACPACGSDHQTGWKNDADIEPNPWATPDSQEYEEILAREFGENQEFLKNRARPGKPKFQQLLAVIAGILALLLLLTYLI